MAALAAGEELTGERAVALLELAALLPELRDACASFEPSELARQVEGMSVDLLLEGELDDDRWPGASSALPDRTRWRTGSGSPFVPLRDADGGTWVWQTGALRWLPEGTPVAQVDDQGEPPRLRGWPGCVLCIFRVNMPDRSGGDPCLTNEYTKTMWTTSWSA